MTLDELRRELERGEPRPFYLLAGDEALLRDDALALLREFVLGGGASDFDFDRLDGAKATPAELVDSVRSLPVLAPRRLVLLRDPAERRGASGGLPEVLAELLEAPEAARADGAVLVVVASKPDRRMRWVKAFERIGCRVQCEPLRGSRELLQFVRAEAGRQAVALEGGAAELLVERVGPQLMILRRELEKAALYAGPGRPVTRDHVAASSSEIAEEPVWELADALGEGRAGDALVVLHKLLAGGAPPPLVLGALASHFRRLLRVRTGGRVRAGGFAARKLEAQARRYRARRLGRCLDAIHEVDEVLKGRGGVAPRLALERLVLGLSG
jgi:DNA polymerase-3 subunit delta